MALPTTERNRRWQAASEKLKQSGLDALVTYSDLGDAHASQRYLSDHRSIACNVSTILFADGTTELIVEHPGVQGLAKLLSWMDEPLSAATHGPVKAANGETLPPGVGAVMADCLAKRGATKIGVTGLETLAAQWKENIISAIPQAEFTEFYDELLDLRVSKSDVELEMVKNSARISDLAWAAVPEMVKPGRKRYEVLADIEHILRLEGCEESFNLFLKLPMLSEVMDAWPGSAYKIEKDEVFSLEISPRYQGYFAQQSGMVATGPIPADLKRAYDATIAAREAGLEIMKAGVDVLEIQEKANAAFNKFGMQSAAPLLGHGIGLELEEPQVVQGSFELKEGMTFMYHPLSVEFPAVFRADTFLITSSGAECLTSGNLEPMVV